MAQIRTLVVDDHEVVREGVKTMLAGDAAVEVVGEASNGLEAIQKVEELHPDVVLMDVRMPEMDGIEATRRIKEAHPEIAVIILTMYEHDVYVIAAVKAGAMGYILKDASRDLLIHTLQVARSGGTLIKSSLLQAAFGKQRPEEPKQEMVPQEILDPGTSARGPVVQRLPRALSSRELEVLKLLVQGKTNREIGDSLSIAELTVKKHVASVIDKLGASNRSDAAVKAVRAGIV